MLDKARAEQLADALSLDDVVACPLCLLELAWLIREGKMPHWQARRARFGRKSQRRSTTQWSKPECGRSRTRRTDCATSANWASGASLARAVALRLAADREPLG